MSHFLTLLKINIKLLLRNKGFLFFLVVTPIVSVIILGLKTETAIINKEYNEEINELKDASSKAIYCGNSQAFAFIVKVYDSSMTELSGYILEKLANTGMFFVCRADTNKMTDEEILKQAEKDAFNDRAGVVLYLKKDFFKGIAEGHIEKAAVTYKVSDDERLDIFNNALSGYLGKVYSLLKAGNGEKETLKILETVQNGLPAKETKVINAVEAHHGDVEPQSLIACLVQAADAISAARPGARRETLEAYIKRLQNLEEIADSFDGVEKSFAIQAGRELRILIVPEDVGDDDMTLMARDIAKKIEEELEYPGQIKVNLIRETRAVEYAK